MGGDTKRIKKYFHILYEVAEEHMEVQEETVSKKTKRVN